MLRPNSKQVADVAHPSERIGKDQVICQFAIKSQRIHNGELRLELKMQAIERRAKLLMLCRRPRQKRRNYGIEAIQNAEWSSDPVYEISPDC